MTEKRGAVAISAPLTMDQKLRRLLRSLIELPARRRLLGLPGVTIADSARVDARRIRVFPGSRLIVGEGSMVGGDLAFEREGAEIVIGSHTSIGNSLIASATSIHVGDGTLISFGCNIVDHDSHSILWRHRRTDVRGWYMGEKNWDHVVSKPVTIGNKCWLGLNAIVLKGVQVGDGAVVAAGSVVTRNVPPWTVVAGNPAKVIRELAVDDDLGGC
jgi:galactoside O-acetyltransferase